MVYICKNNLCTGCSACYAKCPKGAIKMQKDKEGFLQPVIDHDLCINCELCKKVCPINNPYFNNYKKPQTYAVMANDEIRKVSSSGGAFTVLAQHILNQNGLVCAAGYDENMKVCHQIIEKEDDLTKLRGSKYVQSEIGESYKNIKLYLSQGNKVLFIGTPCQVAGLKNFLDKKYENLLTADLICHGVPSPSLFEKYLKEEFNGEKVLNVNFRDKKEGWGGEYILTTTTINGKYSKKDSQDSYLSAFFANISLRKSCYKCKYTRFPRMGDFTIADCWGAKSDINDKKGTSALFINNPKAEEIFNILRNNFKLAKEIPFEFQSRIQIPLRYPAPIHPARTDFYEDLDKMTLKESLKKNICSDKNVALLNYHWENVNFGALLTSFALNRFLNNVGYNAQNINYIPHFPWITEEEPNKYFDDFRTKYLPMTKEYTETYQLFELNDYFKHFIVGSDQVWRYAFIKDDLDAFFFNFTSTDKNLISAAASFGTQDVEKHTGNANNLYQLYLSVFDSVSIREQSGIDYCKNIGIEATCIIDPVFMLDKQEWDKIIDSDKEDKTKNNVVFYTINETLEKEFIEYIKQNKKLLNANRIKNVTFKTSVEEWLYQIKNCDYFITDSFHGVCFAIIFNKPFVCVNKNTITSTRMKYLLDLLGIKNRLYNNFEEVNLEKLLLDRIDYQKANEKLNELSSFSRNWLLNAIAKKDINSERKQALRKEIQENKYLSAKKNIFKYWLKYNKYKIRFLLSGKKKERLKAKLENNRAMYKKCKTTIKTYEKTFRRKNA